MSRRMPWLSVVSLALATAGCSGSSPDAGMRTAAHVREIAGETRLAGDAAIERLPDDAPVKNLPDDALII